MPFVSTQSAPERFWAKVNKDGPTLDEELGPCWIWVGSRGRTSAPRYGFFRDRARHTVTAHRYSYELAYGATNSHVLHRCDNPPCVNPAHLFTGSHDENMADMRAKGRAAWGERGQNKLSSEAVRDLRERYARGGVSHRDLGRLFGVSHQTVGHALRRQTWKLLPIVAALFWALGTNTAEPRAYELLPFRWADKSCLTHDADPLWPAAFAEWSAVSGVRDCGVSPDPDISLEIASPERVAIWEPLGILGVAECYATAGLMDHCVVVVAPAVRDSLAVRVHELGHSLGLSHSHDPDAIMFPSLHGSHTPNADDREGAQALFGQPPERSTALPHRAFVPGLSK